MLQVLVIMESIKESGNVKFLCIQTDNDLNHIDNDT